MKTHIRSKPVGQLTAREVERLMVLTYGPWGAMASELKHLRRLRVEAARAVMLRDERGRILSWALLFSERGRWLAYFFTDPEQRHRGYARRVYLHLFRFADDIKVFIGAANGPFFMKVGASGGLAKKPQLSQRRRVSSSRQSSSKRSRLSSPTSRT